jgi:hypothetical protein
MLLRNLIASSYVMFTTGVASIHLVNISMLTNKNLNPPGALGRMLTMSTPHIVKRTGEIDGSKRIHMLRSLFLEELTLFTLGDDFHHIILSCRPVESVHERFSNHGAS